MTREDEVEKVGTGVAGKLFEFAAVTQLVLQGDQLARYTLIAAVLDRAEIVGVPFRKEGVAGAKRGVMDA